MTEKKKFKISAPYVVVGLIVLGWVVMTLWPSGSREDVPAVPVAKAPPVPVAEAPPEPVAEPEAPRAPTVPEIVDDVPEAGWSTYHGSTALTGATRADVSDELEVLWRYQGEAAVYHTPVTCGERIYFNTLKGGVFALDLDGNPAWSKHLVREIRENGDRRMERFDAPMACFGSTVLAGTMGGTLYAFDTASGEERWTYDVAGPVLGTVNLSPASGPDGSDRVFVIGQDDGTLHSVDLKSGERVWQAESIDRCDGSPAVHDGKIVFGSCAAALHVFSAEDGSLIKNIEIDADSQVAGGVALAGDSIFSGSHSGRVVHANSKTGEVVWINEDNYDEILSTPAVFGEWVVFTSLDGTVHGLDRNTGERRWKFETDGDPTSPIITPDKVIVGSDGILYLLRLSTGEKIWSYEVSDEITSPAIINGMIVVGSGDGTVTAFGNAQS